MMHSKFKELYNHHYNETLEHSHHLPKDPICSHTQFLPQPLATRSIVSVSVDLPSWISTQMEQYLRRTSPSGSIHLASCFEVSVVRQTEQRYFTSQKVMTMTKTRLMRGVMCEPVQRVRDTREPSVWDRMAWKESSIRVKESEVYSNMKVGKKSQDILI